ncbi:MAG: DUF5134 domain-containing protein [Arthrobacter oryzae]
MLAPFLSFPVSLILAAGTVFCLTKALQGSSWVPRLNYGVHALMALGMLGMVWHNIDLPLLPQLLLFSTASFWFLLQAVSRHEFNLVCHVRSERLTCLYHAAMLAAMVFMLALPHSAVLQGRAAAPVQHNGHASHTGQALTVAPPAASEVSALWIQPAAQVLAVLFAAAVLAWLLPMDRVAAKLRFRKAPSMSRPSRHRHAILERTYEAGAALTMSLMFAATSLQT